MKSFVGCAITTALTIFFAFVAFQVLVVLWRMTLGIDGFRTFNIYSMLWLNHLTTAFIGIAAGWLAPRYEWQRPVLVAVIAAALVEVLHASASGALRTESPLGTLVATAICAGLAAGVAKFRLRFPRRAPASQEHAQ
jgi:hypothetical protein